MWRKGNPLTLLAGMQTDTATIEDCTMENSTMWRVLKKLGIELPYDPEIPLLVICPKETRKTHMYPCSLTDWANMYACMHALMPYLESHPFTSTEQRLETSWPPTPPSTEAATSGTPESLAVALTNTVEANDCSIKPQGNSIHVITCL